MTQRPKGTSRLKPGRHDTWPNDIQHNDTDRNNKKRDTQHNSTRCCLYWESFMLRVTNEPIVLGVVMLSVFLVNVVAPKPSLACPPTQLCMRSQNWKEAKIFANFGRFGQIFFRQKIFWARKKFWLPFWVQYFKTFYSCNLLRFVINYSACP